MYNDEHHVFQVKPEPAHSPDLLEYHFTFTPPYSGPNHHRFGPSRPTLVSWGSPQTAREHVTDPQLLYPSPMSYSDGDGVEGWDGLAELPQDVVSTGTPSLGTLERNVRRRTSKACDQCRKSKCKCERPNPNEPCKNCLVLGTSCTFLGPSRKRGPPKGYIDAIEARLHQAEALLGIMLSTTDNRAQSLLRDIAKDAVAKEIINRVDNSPYGVKGRKREDAAAIVDKAGSPQWPEPSQTMADSESLDLRSMHPSNEWQDQVVALLNSLTSSLPQDYSSPKSEASEGSQTSRRQRRRVGTEDYRFRSHEIAKAPSESATSLQENQSGVNTWHSTPSPAWGDHGARMSPMSKLINTERRSSSVDSAVSEHEDELLSAVGQLSLNEDEQIRYHGKASGIYILGKKERVDRRNEGGIWRFPKARVWPLLPTSHSLNESDLAVELPSKEVQGHLLNLYFTYVHPFLPIIHKKSFMDAFREEGTHDKSSSDPPAGQTKIKRRRHDIPNLLLLAMFACASRYDSNTTPFPSDPSLMWPAGDEYLDRAKFLLNSTYASARPQTVQALLLMGYREAGIGDMSLAWTYVGMGIRMAQDLGMHRLADGWKRGELGESLFNEWQLAERRRIWFGCVVLDKFISAFIGRPVMVYEEDFDTLLPNVDDLEETEDWSVEMALGERSFPAPGRIMSCFNAYAVLFDIFGKIIQSLYAIRAAGNQQAEAAILESALDKWYLELPEHLRCEMVNSGSGISDSLKKSNKPLPNVVALHMHYWTTVLVLHRPFIAHLLHRKGKHPDEEDPETQARISRNYELCRTAALHVASLVSLYQETYLFQRCPPLLIYCLFSSSILLDADIAKHPNDPQARLAFSRCVNGLNAMSVVWPSAGRALALFTGAKTADTSMVELTHSKERNKRAAEEDLDDSYDGVSNATTHDVIRHPPRVGHPPIRFEFVSPRPHMSNMGNTLQYSQQSLIGPPPIFTGDRGYMQPPLPSPSASPPAGFGATSSVDGYMPDMSAFSAQLATAAVLPQLYSSGFADDVEVSLHGMQPPQQNFLPYSSEDYVPYSYPQHTMGRHMGPYELQEQTMGQPVRAYQPHHRLHLRQPSQPQSRPHPQQQQPSLQTRHQQQGSQPYLQSHQYNVYL